MTLTWFAADQAARPPASSPHGSGSGPDGRKRPAECAGTQIKLLAHRLVEIARAGAHERGEVRICYTDRHTRARAGERTVAKSKYAEELAHQIIEKMIDGELVDGAREGQGAVRGPACRR